MNAAGFGGALALMTGRAVTAAIAAPPTPAQLRVAEAQVHTAQQRLTDVQVQAEPAAKTYNGGTLSGRHRCSQQRTGRRSRDPGKRGASSQCRCPGPRPSGADRRPDG